MIMMRRGFLTNRSLDPAAASSSAQTTTAIARTKSTGAVASTANNRIALPSWPVELDEDVPDVPAWAPRAMVGTSMPPRTRCNADEPRTVCLIPAETEAQLLALRGFPRPLPASASPRYRLGAVPGAGIGMFAVTAVTAGDVVMRERPLLVYTVAMAEDVVVESGGSGGSRSAMHMDGHQFLEAQVNMMCKADREALLALHDCESVGVPTLRGIMSTNAMHVGSLPGYDARCSAVCRDISRVNHSCCPNAYALWDLQSFAFELRACVPIQPGDEITIAYVTAAAPRAVRHQELAAYRFTCRCRACVLSGPALQQSDALRRLIARCAMPPTDDVSPEAWVCNLALPDDLLVRTWAPVADAMEREGVLDRDAGAVCYPRLCKAYCALGDAEGATRVARCAEVLWLVYTGREGEWAEIAASPWRTTWWGLRAAMRAAARVKRKVG